MSQHLVSKNRDRCKCAVSRAHLLCPLRGRTKQGRAYTYLSTSLLRPWTLGLRRALLLLVLTAAAAAVAAAVCLRSPARLPSSAALVWCWSTPLAGSSRSWTTQVGSCPHVGLGCWGRGLYGCWVVCTLHTCPACPASAPSPPTLPALLPPPTPHPAETGGLRRFALAIHCGGCMVDHQKIRARISDLKEAGVPVTNYGLLLSYAHSPAALQRALAPWGLHC